VGQSNACSAVASVRGQGTRGLERDPVSPRAPPRPQCGAQNSDLFCSILQTSSRPQVLAPCQPTRAQRPIRRGPVDFSNERRPKNSPEINDASRVQKPHRDVSRSSTHSPIGPNTISRPPQTDLPVSQSPCRCPAGMRPSAAPASSGLPPFVLRALSFSSSSNAWRGGATRPRLLLLATLRSPQSSIRSAN